MSITPVVRLFHAGQGIFRNDVIVNTPDHVFKLITQ